MIQSLFKRRTILVLLTALLLSLTVFSNFGDAGRASGTAQYFRVMWNGDASSSATIGWSSDADPKVDQRLYYDTVDFGTDYNKYRFSSSITTSNKSYGMYQAFVRLKDLTPNTAYYFLVANSAGTSRRLMFVTAPSSSNERVSIIAGGDSRNNRLPRQNANLLVSKLRPHAVMFGGDMTDSGTDKQWKEWLEDWQKTISSDGRVTPLIITRGNHERDNQILVNLFDTVPTVYYSVTLGSDLLRIYTLNSESSIAGAQTDWLKKDLQENQNVLWKFAQYHRPMRPHVKSKSEGDVQYAYWAQFFYDYKMNIVIESDAHTVKSTWPLAPAKSPASESGFIRDDLRGTVYLGEGCWGAPLRTNDDLKSWTRDSGKFNHFNWIFVDKARIEVRTINVDNAPKVESLTDNNRFEIPRNLNIWKPSNGELIVINK